MIKKPSTKGLKEVKEDFDKLRKGKFLEEIKKTKIAELKSMDPRILLDAKHDRVHVEASAKPVKVKRAPKSRKPTKAELKELINLKEKENQKQLFVTYIGFALICMTLAALSLFVV